MLTYLCLRSSTTGTLRDPRSTVSRSSQALPPSPYEQKHVANLETYSEPDQSSVILIDRTYKKLTTLLLHSDSLLDQTNYAHSTPTLEYNLGNLTPPPLCLYL
ncbi:hypothetical protein Pst134EB_020533 [Puccinia striiformis f. sp. tritici]|nr:hypothetical protein Pst134EB_020533 [Puccinia striiformis f. sp. tritici]